MPTGESINGSTAGAAGERIAVRLKRRPSAAGDARSLVRMSLGSVLAKETLEDVLVVISELVTNAVLYGQGDIGLSLSYDEQRVAGEISDQGTGFAEQQQHERPRDPSRIGGNGLFMVGRIAERWGLRDGPTQVWFEIAAPRAN